MRFGCCGNLVASGPDRTGIEIIEKIAGCGYDYIELPLAEMTELSETEFQNLKERVKASGISCEVCNNLFPASVRLTGPEMDPETIQKYLKKALKRAGELGVDTVVFGSGGAKTVPEGFSFKEAYAQIIQITKMLAPMAAEHGITVAIEPIRKPECNIINTFKEGIQQADDADCANVRVLIDYYHMTWEKEPIGHLLEHGRKYLQHVHFAYPNMSTEEGLRFGRTYPADLSEWDYEPFIGALKEIDYQGRVSIEAGAYDFDRQAQKALSFLKTYFK